MNSLNIVFACFNVKLANDSVQNNPRLRVLSLLDNWTTRNQLTKEYWETFLEKKYKGKGAPIFIKEIIDDFDDNDWLKKKDHYTKVVSQVYAGKPIKRIMKIKNAIKLNEKQFLEDFAIFEKFSDPFLIASFLDNYNKLYRNPKLVKEITKKINEEMKS